ncbi:hypothetical protein XA68_16021 [Ophiocordyceps unilateralis]|uniref:Uncharacterized protein n=1 Tax=Ophiocordyceps unilateralis TaxID=268505 RepID=A0A2A9P7B8_OPHUN|nr:hypothetical protein XA68_16021 [Ophiocordyceps unilateralis]
MLDLVFLIFAIELVAHLVNTIGSSRINGLAWTLINYLPVSTSKAAAQQRQLQTEYLKVRRDLNATSSQDEFAKWAKLRRQHDKLLEKLEASKKGLEASRAKFDNFLWVARLLLTKLPQYFVPFWYGKQPMFWLPHGWFPYYAEWIISFPTRMHGLHRPGIRLGGLGRLHFLPGVQVQRGCKASTEGGHGGEDLVVAAASSPGCAGIDGEAGERKGIIGATLTGELELV